MGVTYGNLQHELLAIVLRLERVENSRELGGVELDCEMVNIAPN